MNHLFSRRDAIKTFLVVSAASIIENKLWASKGVSEVTANSIDPSIGLARVKLSDFPSLNANGGSVRLTSCNFAESGANLLFYPIIINRISATEYVTLDSACTHEGGVVGPYNSSTGGMTCPLHSSRFNIRGVVQAGSEARLNLFSYPTTVSNGVLTIRLDDRGFNITQIAVQNAAEQRVALSFDSFSPYEYEVRYKSTLDAEGVRVNFATTATGNFTSTFITGNNGIRTIYVLGQNGIYQIVMRLRAA